jgi:HlyD family secretion protein
MPRREFALGLGVAGLFLAILIGWGSFARLDAAVVAPGQITVFGNKQTVQHRDGGIVAELDAHEGDHVRMGQVLLRLNPNEVNASEKADAAQVIELKAQQARLMAELEGHATIQFPPEFANLTGEEKVDAQAAMVLQQQEFRTRKAALGTAKSVLTQREKESAEQIGGYQRQVTANREQQRLINEEINSLKRLQDLGLVPATRVRSLQRSGAELTGNEGEYTANIARTQQEIGENRIRVSDLERERAADDSKDYQAAEFQLAELQPKLAALREQLDRTVVRSPATGRVVGLTIFTIGGVIAPGQKLMDIVPDNEPLVIEAKVRPSDVSDLKIGQKTEVRISAFHDRGMPTLNGIVSKISADSLTEEKTGATFFMVEVTVPPSEIKHIQERRGDAHGLQAGLPVELVVPLGRRTALGYLVDPLRQTLWKSFREH